MPIGLWQDIHQAFKPLLTHLGPQGLALYYTRQGDQGTLAMVRADGKKVARNACADQWPQWHDTRQTLHKLLKHHQHTTSFSLLLLHEGFAMMEDGQELATYAHFSKNPAVPKTYQPLFEAFPSLSPGTFLLQKGGEDTARMTLHRRLDLGLHALAEEDLRLGVDCDLYAHITSAHHYLFEQRHVLGCSKRHLLWGMPRPVL